MISHTQSKSEPATPDPEQLARLLEIELIQKRAKWKNDNQSWKSLRLASYTFIFLVVVGALLAFFLLFNNAAEERASRQNSTHPLEDQGP